jgi:hypothetical protein
MRNNFFRPEKEAPLHVSLFCNYSAGNRGSGIKVLREKSLSRAISRLFSGRGRRVYSVFNRPDIPPLYNWQAAE